MLDPLGDQRVGLFAGDRHRQQVGLLRRSRPGRRPCASTRAPRPGSARRSSPSWRNSPPAGCPGWIGAVIPARGAGVAEAQEILVVEEELGERDAGARVDLALEVVDVRRRARRLGMHLRIGRRPRSRSRRPSRSACDQLGRAGEARPDAARTSSRPSADRRGAPRSAAPPAARSRARPRASPRGWRRRRSGARRRSAAPAR